MSTTGHTTTRLTGIIFNVFGMTQAYTICCNAYFTDSKVYHPWTKYLFKNLKIFVYSLSKSISSIESFIHLSFTTKRGKDFKMDRSHPANGS